TVGADGTLLRADSGADTGIKWQAPGPELNNVPKNGAALGNSEVVETDGSGNLKSVAKGTAYNKNFGTTAGTVAQGDDSRIVNGQTAFSWGNHAEGGYAAAADLLDHTEDTSNPHGVT